MWFVCTKGGQDAGTTIRLGHTEAKWENVVFRGRHHTAAQFDADADPLLAAQLAQFPSHVVAHDHEVTVALPDAGRVSVSVGAGSIAYATTPSAEIASPVRENTAEGLSSMLVRLALRLGWGREDLAEILDIEGARSPVSGLTLAEHTLTAPPVDWYELRANGRPPWESSSWVAPGPDWVRPGWRDPVMKVVEATDTTIGSPILPEGAVVDPLDMPETEEDAPPAEDVTAMEEDIGSDVDPAVAAGYPAEAVAAARSVALEWRSKLAEDKAPHPSALNYYLAKAELPKCAPSAKAVAQMAGLLSTL